MRRREGAFPGPSATKSAAYCAEICGASSPRTTRPSSSGLRLACNRPDSRARFVFSQSCASLASVLSRRSEIISLMLSVRSFQLPATPGTLAWPPSLPSEPTSRVTRITSAVNARS